AGFVEHEVVMRATQDRQRAAWEMGVQRASDVEVDVGIPGAPHDVGERTERGQARDATGICRRGRERVGSEGTKWPEAAGSCEELLAEQRYERSRDLCAAEERPFIPVEDGL